MKLESQVAVVTGAGSGMGRQIAILYAQEGSKVIVSDVNEKGSKETVEEIEKNNGTATAVLADVTKEADVQHLIDTAVDTYGTLDILVNNAGMMDNMMPVAEVTDELWEKVLAVNTTGPMRATRKALPIFLEKGRGVIVNMGSSASLAGSRAGAAYTASKHALAGYTKNVGFQYANNGIRCNAIAPGGVATNIGTTMSEPDEFGMERALSGSGNNPRNGEAEEVARIALFLASDDSAFINGEIIRADAGWLAY
ncbi:SDR family oxidoreductase [Salimicrobium jeotgali]|uniref:SDR family oxidoreductase n=1 Tax=Salimicrobium jeotgali TaxID=1230341 RepID=UPI000C81EA1D|nr:SDR family oxidoreductase [Salimicrobium jeotgali]